MTLTIEEYNKIALKEDVNRLEKKVDDLSADVKNILSAVDNITKKFETTELELSSNIEAHDRMSTEISSHELRIKNLELKTI